MMGRRRPIEGMFNPMKYMPANKPQVPQRDHAASGDGADANRVLDHTLTFG
jgi:hypothetical protein